MGLPILARIPAVSAPSRSRRKAEQDAEYDSLRRLALRIQQYVDKPGYVVVFSSLTEQAIPVELLAKLAQCFADRGERVLYVDLQSETAARTSAAVPALLTAGVTAEGSSGQNALTVPNGLADYLTMPDVTVEGIVKPTDIPSVDVVTAGSVPVPREGFGTRRMSDLIGEVRQMYSLVLINGPGITRSVDLELLASRADGIVFGAIQTRAIDPLAETVVRDLLEVDGPVLGAFR